MQCAHHGAARKPARARPSCRPNTSHERLCATTVDRRTEHHERPANKETPAGRSAFSLHAAVRCGADDRQALEQLCRYITRPALANERVQTNAVGQVVFKLKTA
ncbi:MAG TPA: transposase [Anaerolineae bacterium]|nr:transposase [Anaerolineae bacterium]